MNSERLLTPPCSDPAAINPPTPTANRPSSSTANQSCGGCSIVANVSQKGSFKVTVYVGQLAHPFHVPRKQLRSESSSFKSSIYKNPGTPSTFSLRLPDVKITTFHAFTLWLQTGRLGFGDAIFAHDSRDSYTPNAIYDESHDRFCCTSCYGPVISSDSNGGATLGQEHVDLISYPSCLDSGYTGKLHGGRCRDCAWNHFIPVRFGSRKIRPTASVGTAWTATFANDRLLFDLYIFAWNFKIIKMQRDILTTWIWQDNDRNTLPDWQLIERAFSALPRSAPLWQYFVDVHVFYWVDDAQEDNRSAFKSQFIGEVLRHREERSYSSPYRPDPCKYHKHETRNEASKCQGLRLPEEGARNRKRVGFEQSLGVQNPKLAEVLENESDSDDDDTERPLKRRKSEEDEGGVAGNNALANTVGKREPTEQATSPARQASATLQASVTPQSSATLRDSVAPLASAPTEAEITPAVIMPSKPTMPAQTSSTGSSG